MIKSAVRILRFLRLCEVSVIRCIQTSSWGLGRETVTDIGIVVLYMVWKGTPMERTLYGNGTIFDRKCLLVTFTCAVHAT